MINFSPYMLIVKEFVILIVVDTLWLTYFKYYSICLFLLWGLILWTNMIKSCKYLIDIIINYFLYKRIVM